MEGNVLRGQFCPKKKNARVFFMRAILSKFLLSAMWCFFTYLLNFFINMRLTPANLNKHPTLLVNFCHKPYIK